MMKTNGKPLTSEEFSKLVTGDVYFHVPSKSARVFHHFGSNDPASGRAVNTSGKYNDFGSMNWLSENQYKIWLNARASGADHDRSAEILFSEMKASAMKDEERLTKVDPMLIAHLNKIKEASLTENKETEIKVIVKKETGKMANVVREESRVQHALAVVKSDATDAVWRTAARQTVRSAKTPLVALLGRQALPPGVVGFLVSQLDTDNGEALLAFVLGTALTYVPQFGTDPKFVRLARELRILGMDNFISKVADVMLNPVREQLVDILKAVPLEMPNVPADRAG
jgi:hypothetical protein